MKEKTQAPQGARPKVVLTLVVILLAVLVCPFILMHKSSKVVQQIPVQTPAPKAVLLSASRPQQIAYVPPTQPVVQPSNKIAFKFTGLRLGN